MKLYYLKSQLNFFVITFLAILVFIFITIPTQAYQVGENWTNMPEMTVDSEPANGIDKMDFIIDNGYEWTSFYINRTKYLLINDKYFLTRDAFAHTVELNQLQMPNGIWYFEDEFENPFFNRFNITENNVPGRPDEWSNNDRVKVINRNLGNVDLSSTNPVPEPATMVLLGLGLVMIASVGKKKLKMN